MLLKLLLWIVWLVLYLSSAVLGSWNSTSRCSFPKDFIFGASSSAYQFEGAVAEDGRGPSIWDAYAHITGNIGDGSNADVALDQYHRFREDILLLEDLGVDAYRFSISWTRIFSDGNGSRVNQKGLEHYNAVIDALLEKGIQPFVTLFHYDTPQALEDSFNGWLGSEIIDKFTAYAETCFEAFGDRVKNWITMNEPHNFIRYGYCENGVYPPQRCSGCTNGGSGTEPYVAGHNMLLAHAAAVQIYKQKFQVKQGGKIGISLDSQWFEPFSNTSDDKAAAERAKEFEVGWFLSPLVFGDYPPVMREFIGDRLPTLTATQASIVQGSFDFIGINHYTAHYARNNPVIDINTGSCLEDTRVLHTNFRDGLPIGEPAATWQYVVSWGFRELLNHIKAQYNNPTIIITENGFNELNDPFKTLNQSLQDTRRISYHRDYLSSLLTALRVDGVDVRGYFAWSFLDNWEWNFGFDSRFGLYFIDYKNDLRRYPKASALWFKNFLSPCDDDRRRYPI